MNKSNSSSTTPSSSGELDKDLKEEIKEEVDEVKSVVRTLPGAWQATTYVIAVIMSLFHIWVNTFGVMPGIYRNAVHMGFVLILVFSLYPASKKHPKRYLSFDVILAFLAAIVAIYILLFEEELHLERASVPTKLCFKIT